MHEDGARGPTTPVTLAEAEKYVTDRMRGKRSPNRLVKSETTSQGEPLVVVKNLKHTYPGLEKGIEALRGVSFTINKGEFVALIGQNGSGKSTLALHLVGILKPTNKDAIVEVAGLNAAKVRSKELIKRINYVYQNPDDKSSARKCRRRLLLGFRLRTFRAKKSREEQLQS